MKVLFLPDYSHSNAYQRELMASIGALGVTVVGDRTRRRRTLPMLEAARTHGLPDVIHLHWTEPYIAGGPRVSPWKVRRTLMELRLLKRAGSALVWTAHDLLRHDQPPDPREQRFTKALVGLSDAVIVHCESAESSLSRALDLSAGERSRLRVIPHGHYLGAYPNDIGRSESRKRLGLPGSARVVTFLGWVRPYKGIQELIAAFSRCAPADARLIIAGKPADDDFGAEVRLQAADDKRIIVKLGFVPDDELQLYLNAADVVAAPYREILTSGTILLAMSFGRAVIAPRLGCIEDILGEGGGILYDPADRDGLANALDAAMGIDLDALGRHNQQRAAAFDWGQVAEATVAVYKEVCRGSRRRT